MSFTSGFQRVLANGLEDYNAPVFWTISDIKVTVKPSAQTNGEKTWKHILEEWLPKFEQVGWLDKFNRIYIGNDITQPGSVGQYNHNGSIDLETDPEITGSDALVVNDDRESVLIHEFIHHAHLTLNGFEGSRQPALRETDLQNDVSHYAGENVGESIAEIGVGLVLGEDFPRWVHEYYEEKDGPQEAYDLRHG